MPRRRKKKVPASGNRIAQATLCSEKDLAQYTTAQKAQALALIGLPHAVLVCIGFWSGPNALAIGLVVLIGGIIWSENTKSRSFTVRYFPSMVGIVWIINHIIGSIVSYPILLLVLLGIVAHGLYSASQEE